MVIGRIKQAAVAAQQLGGRMLGLRAARRTPTQLLHSKSLKAQLLISSLLGFADMRSQNIALACYFSAVLL